MCERERERRKERKKGRKERKVCERNTDSKIWLETLKIERERVDYILYNKHYIYYNNIPAWIG